MAIRGLFRRLLHPLSVLQLSSILTAGFIVVGLALLLRHYTDNVWIAPVDYLLSFNIALPPLALFLLSYAIAFVVGIQLSEVPRHVVGYLKNSFFQSKRQQLSFLAIGLLFFAVLGTVLSYTTPPKYALFVSQLLSAEADQFSLIGKQIDIIHERNKPLAARLRIVAQVFETRAKNNYDELPISPIRASALVRALEADPDESFARHPLRLLALAEAYALFSQAISQASEQVDAVRGPRPETKKLHDQAVRLHARIANFRGYWATDEIRYSSQNNLGNLYFYAGATKEAVDAWRTLLGKPGPGARLATASNLVAGLIVLRQFDDAIREGERARDLAERSGAAITDTSRVAGVIGNVGFARLMKKDWNGALNDFRAAFSYHDDHLSRLNLALALVFAGQTDKSDEFLREKFTPVDAKNQADIAKKSDRVPCAYFIWSLVGTAGHNEIAAARLYTYMGIGRTPSELASENAASVAALKSRVVAALKRDRTGCGTLVHIPAVVERLLAAD